MGCTQPCISCIPINVYGCVYACECMCGGWEGCARVHMLQKIIIIIRLLAYNMYHLVFSPPPKPQPNFVCDFPLNWYRVLQAQSDYTKAYFHLCWKRGRPAAYSCTQKVHIFRCFLQANIQCFQYAEQVKDEGGPQREFFCHLIKEALQQPTLFARSCDPST